MFKHHFPREDCEIVRLFYSFRGGQKIRKFYTFVSGNGLVRI